MFQDGTTFGIGRRQWLRSVLGASAALGVGGLSLQAASPLRKLKVYVGRDESLCHLPLTVADQLGYFKAEGLDVQLIEQATPVRGAELLATSQADMVSGSCLQVLREQGVKKGPPLQAFVLEGRAPMVCMGVSPKLMPNYRGVRDLRGQRIGVSSAGSMTHVLAQLAIGKAGLRPDEVTWVGLGAMGDAAQSLRAGEVQALCHIDPAMTQLEQGGELRLIADTRTLKGSQEVFGGPMPATCVFATRAFVEGNPQVCQAAAHAVVRALKWLQTAEPPDIIKTVPEDQTMGDRALYLAAFFRVRECYSPDGAVTPEAMRTAWSVAARLGLAGNGEAETVLARSFNNDFVTKARVKLKAMGVTVQPRLS